MKKIASYSIILVIGLLLGWFFFGRKNENHTPSHSQNEQVETHQHTEVQEWTCSMHPQIRQPEQGDCPICGMDLIPVDSSDSKKEIPLKNNQIKMSNHALALANVQTTEIGFSDYDSIKKNKLELSGQIEENESSLYTQTAHIGGRLESFKVTYEGEYVKKGQPIGTIYSPELVTAQQELLIATESKKIQPEIYHAVRQKLKLWKLSDKEINEIEYTKNIKTNFPLYADASGVVKQKMVTIGTHVQTGTPLYTLVNLSKVWVVLEAYEKDIQYVKVGQSVSIKTPTFPNKEFKGTISFIEPMLNTQTRTIPIRVEIVNKNMNLKPGMLATAIVELPINHNMEKGLLVPKSAVIWTGKRSIIYVKSNTEEPIFEMREVELGNRVGDNFRILQGLNKGEIVVTNGAFTIDSEAQLLGKNSVMNSPKETKHTISPIIADDIFKNQLITLYNIYIEYKDFLVNDDKDNAKNKAIEALYILGKINDENLNESAKVYWADLKNQLNSTLNNISNSSNIAAQRDYFINFSTNLLLAIEAFRIKANVYEVYCPMANDNQGAMWLSDEDKVLNPYFGSRMLKCGEVRRLVTQQ